MGMTTRPKDMLLECLARECQGENKCAKHPTPPTTVLTSRTSLS